MPADPSGPRAPVVQVYTTVRSYIEHEDKLISDRISRTLLVHGFLLASGVLLIQSRVEAVAKCMGRDQGCWTTQLAAAPNMLPPQGLMIVLLFIDLLLPLIALIGIVTTRAALTGVAAAEDAITSVREHWETFASQNRADLQPLGLPNVTGGGLLANEVGGHGSAITLLRNLLALWAIIFLLCVGLALVWHWGELSDAQGWIRSWIDRL
ncbi:MAG: hypothetical protein NW223_16115 [Hyphomicrobiaceae bacterium]|nr:hypothetical protein [Hyphomicrobiaceae bacterium]